MLHTVHINFHRSAVSICFPNFREAPCLTSKARRPESGHEHAPQLYWTKSTGWKSWDPCQGIWKLHDLRTTLKDFQGIWNVFSRFWWAGSTWVSGAEISHVPSVLLQFHGLIGHECDTEIVCMLYIAIFFVLKANSAKSRWWDCLHALHCMFIFCIKSEFCEINMVLWHKIVQLWHCKHVNTRTLSTLLRTARFGQVKNSPALNGQWHKLSNLIDCGVKKSLPKGTNFPSFWVPCA